MRHFIFILSLVILVVGCSGAAPNPGDDSGENSGKDPVIQDGADYFGIWSFGVVEGGGLSFKGMMLQLPGEVFSPLGSGVIEASGNILSKGQITPMHEVIFDTGTKDIDMVVTADLVGFSGSAQFSGDALYGGLFAPEIDGLGAVVLLPGDADSIGAFCGTANVPSGNHSWLMSVVLLVPNEKPLSAQAMVFGELSVAGVGPAAFPKQYATVVNVSGANLDFGNEADGTPEIIAEWIDDNTVEANVTAVVDVDFTLTGFMSTISLTREACDIE